MMNSFCQTPIRPRKIPLEIVHRIRKLILSKEIEPGTKLPSEAELINQFGVSRQTLREALRALELQGLLEIRAGAGGGAFVTEVSLSTIRMNLTNFLHGRDLTLADLTKTRILIEPYFAEEAAKNMSDVEIAHLEGIIMETRRVLKNNELDNIRNMEMQFHNYLATFSRNPLLILIQDFIETLLLDVKRELTPPKDFAEEVVRSHEKILGAIKTHDPDKAVHAMHEDICSVDTRLTALLHNNSSLIWR